MEEDGSVSDRDVYSKTDVSVNPHQTLSHKTSFNYDHLLDVKPRHLPAIGHTGEFPDLQNIQSTPGISWPSSSWQDGSRKSAFQPYRPTTLLTNLQRGNTQTQTPVLDKEEMTLHERAGQGEISKEDLYDQNVDVLDENHLTPLMWACAYGQLPTAILLVDEGAQIDKTGVEGETALLLAAAGGHHDIIKVLLSKGANVNKTDYIGNTALMYAAHGNHPHCVSELLQRGADMTISNGYGHTAYAIVIHNGSQLAQTVIENHLLTLLT